MEYVDARTKLYDQFSGANCSSHTDVVYVEGDGGAAGRRGYTVCVYGGTGSCDQFWVVTDVPEIFTQTVDHGGDGDNYTVNLVKTIRHETGHTIGLNNDGQYSYDTSLLPSWADAMVSGWVDTNLLWMSYSDHHVSHINAFSF